jgi:AcrR family transcriptional regulator
MDARENREKTIKDAKCTLILDAAKTIFAQHGFHATRLEDIAAAAGFSKASLYNYYPNKESIFLHLALREYAALTASIEQDVSDGLSLEDTLHKTLQILLRALGKHFALLLEISDFRSMPLFCMGQTPHDEHLLQEELLQHMEKLKCFFVLVLKNARQRGELKAALSEEKLADYLAAQVRGVIFEWKFAGKMGDVDKEIESMLTFMLHGLCGISEHGAE